MKRSVTFHWDEELVRRLKELSKETYIPQTKLAAMAIEEFIDKKEKEGGK